MDNDLYYSATTDPDGCLDKIFWEMKNGLERWAEDCDNNPAFFDTSHGTNKYCLKFGALITVDMHGITVILAIRY